VETDVRPLRDMFRTNVHYIVPKFQRRYLWTKENWESLWHDVEKTVRRDVGAHVGSGHFLGAVVLEERRSRRSNTTEYLIVDGQQRLTTLQLFIAAVREVAKEFGLKPAIATQADRLGINEDVGAEDPREQLKVWPTRGDFPKFQLAMTDSPAALRKKFGKEESTVLKAYFYFVDRVTRWAMSLDQDANDAFQRMIDVIYAGLHMVVIRLGKEDNPQAIFESLNARGLPLKASDLVRNYVFRVAEERELDAEDLYAQYWERFEDGHWGEETKRGNTELPHMDAFLTDFLWIELREQVTAQQIFLTFRDYVDGAVGTDSLPLPEVMMRVADYGAVYYSLEWPEAGELTDFETEFLNRFKALGIASVMPVLLHTFVQLSPALREPVLRHLDSYLWRRAAVGLPASYADLMDAFVKVLDNAGEDPSPEIEAFLAGQTAASNFWPSDEDVRTAATARPIDKIKGPRLRHLLAVVDARLQNRTSESVRYDPLSLTLEHLLPQRWKPDAWPLGSATRDQRERLIHTLGNLTLLRGELNIREGNGPWRVKRQAIVDHSKLNLNLRLPELWDEAAIEDRGKEFVHLLLQAFPRPVTLATATEAPESVDDDDEESDDLAATPTSGAPFVRSVAKHIAEALQAKGPGAVMTVRELATAHTSHYAGNANLNTIRWRLKNNSVSGVESTTNGKGHLAARLAPPKRPKGLKAATIDLKSQKKNATAVERRLATELVEACGQGKRLGYPRNDFVALINLRGSVAAVRHVLAGSIPEAVVGLARLNRLDLAAETIIQRPEFAALVTPEQLALAGQRLQEARTRADDEPLDR
jgi:Protein of unknown function DUF262/Protein of unknown function (DUF1524)